MRSETMLHDLLGTLQRERWYHGQVVLTETVPAQAARHRESPLSPPLAAYLETRGIALYRHQADVIDGLSAGRNVILTTPTASGKTLAFNLPVFEAMLSDPTASALYLYPLKALANDQREKLLDLEEATGLDLRPEVYDGDTPTGRRARIKATSRIILTNPHALHYYLAWHHQWARFFRSLRYIVIDEAHQYRGVFGTNVALLLRRLLRLVDHYGGRPQLVLSSASIANPVRFAALLTGRPAVSVSNGADARGERHILFWDALLDPRRSLTTQAASLLTVLTKAGVQTLCFAGSRVMAELIARTARDMGAPNVDSYRAGYLPAERRRLEAALRERRLEGIVSTNALEAGIDIGSLDAVLLVGFPGSLLSAWQQAGRAGRGTDPSLIAFMPGENPLDRYFLRHPDAFVGREREEIVIQPGNPRLSAWHLACAAAELPLRREEIDAKQTDLVDSLVRSGVLADTPRGAVYHGGKRAHDLLSLDALPGAAVQVVCEGKLLETMDVLRARREAYPGAVLLHQGETYVAETLDLEGGTATVRREDVDYYTKPLQRFDVRILDTQASRETDGLDLARGRVRVIESFIGYKTTHADRSVSVDPLDLPDHSYETDAVWISFREPPSDLSSDALLGGLHGAEHALIAMAPLLILCDREDLSGLSTPLHDQTHLPTVLLFDEIEGGAGLTESLYGCLDRLVEKALRLVADCPCDNGCPSCLYSPRCGSYNRPLDKAAAVRVLSFLSRALTEQGEAS
jgi:DEAD/DEAH box helicase domain-containing protein